MAVTPKPFAVTDKILDRYIAHRHFLRGVERDLAEQVIRILQRGEKQALGEVVSIYERALASGEVTLANSRGLRTQVTILRRIQRAMADVRKTNEKIMVTRLASIAKEEQAHWLRTVKGAFPKAVDTLAFSAIPERQLLAMVRDPFGGRLEGAAKVLANQLRQLESTLVQRAFSAIQDGIRDGDGVDGMVRRVRNAIGSDTLGGHNLRSVVRQQVIRTANDVAGELAAENSDVVQGEQYVATLDNRTCPICGPLDGKTYKLGQGVPRPPRHPNCRCFMVPWIRSWRSMGLTGLSSQARKVLSGKPADRVTWNEWVLKRPGRLRAVLGPTRARLVRQGKLRLSDLSTTTRTLRITELRRKVGEAMR